ncbi:hypothetical protein [Ruminococcus sp.]|uniref:hypothetical protein n=1 Tax=Ruminococcus sp. TaxID=41978 RepID=UPI0025DBCE97|nr:hypothetical protein [Ruminococcus sp.]MCR4638584.1 hypothetical protein [Ruminococcus sp.]
MNDHIKVRTFLAELRKFLPERTIYSALSSLPEDIFDKDENVKVPCFENDDEVQEFIKKNGFEEYENLANFFLEPYYDSLEDEINAILKDLEGSENVKSEIESITYDLEYMSIYG